MKPNLSKYFWSLNETALRQTRKILRNPVHPKFTMRIVALLSRCDNPEELFSLISKKQFVRVWPEIKSYWIKIERDSDFRDWWQTIYEQLLQKYNIHKIIPRGKPSLSFLKIGRTIKEARVYKGLSQNGLAFKVGMKQPDISMIEKGKKNITLETLSILCKALEIKKINLR